MAIQQKYIAPGEAVGGLELVTGNITKLGILAPTGQHFNIDNHDIVIGRSQIYELEGITVASISLGSEVKDIDSPILIDYISEGGTGV